MSDATIVFGIATYEGEVPELSTSLRRRIEFLEHRVGSIDDVARCAGPESWCIAHAGDPTDPGWREVIAALAEVPSVRAVNVHPRPEDTCTLCRECSRRLRNLQDPRQRCSHCGTLVGEWQHGPGLDACGDAAVFGHLEYAARLLDARGKQLLLENTYEPPELLESMLSRLPRGVGFTLDVGHSLLYHAGPNDYVHRLAPWLAHLHLHDNMGGNSERYHDSHLPPGCGRANWLALARALRSVGFRGTATFECMPSEDWLDAWRAKLGLDRGMVP
jgi:hypothetical protein